jgi:hypothetical protein
MVRSTICHADIELRGSARGQQAPAGSSPVPEHDLGYGYQITVHNRRGDLLPHGTIPATGDRAFCAFFAEQGIPAATDEVVNYFDIIWGIGLVSQRREAYE